MHPVIKEWLQKLSNAPYGMNAHSVPVVVDAELFQLGWAKREQDKRAYRVVITADGRAALEKE